MHRLSFTSGVARPCYDTPSVGLDGKIILRTPVLTIHYQDFNVQSLKKKKKKLMGQNNQMIISTNLK